MKHLARCVVLMGLAAGAVWAKTGTPGPAYFAGQYDYVGRSAGDAPQLAHGAAQIIAQGQNVVIRRCAAPDVVMSFGPAFEIVNLMTGRQLGAGAQGDVIECLFHNNGSNRPILTCTSQAGAAFTLWPLGVGAPPLAC